MKRPVSSILSVLNTMLNCVDGSYQDEDITLLKLNAVLDRVFGMSTFQLKCT